MVNGKSPPSRPVTPLLPGAMSVALATPGVVAALLGCWVATGCGRGATGMGTSAGFFVDRPKASGGAVFFTAGFSTGFAGAGGGTGAACTGFFGAACGGGLVTTPRGFTRPDLVFTDVVKHGAGVGGGAAAI